MSCEKLLRFFPLISEYEELRLSYIANCVLNIFLNYTAVMLNILTIHAIRKTSPLPKTTKTLLVSLSVSDVGVGLVVQPFYSSLLVNWLQQGSISCYTCRVFLIIGFLIFQASFLGVMAVTVDRFLAVYLHLRYQQLVTHRRIVAVVTSIWVFSAFASFIRLSGVRFIQPVIQYIGILLGLVVITGVYIKLYFVVRRHKTQIQSLQVQRGPRGELTQTASRIKSAIAIFYVYVAFLVCCLPYVICVSIIQFNGPSVTLKGFHLFSLNLIFLNSSLNPLIYCWKMRHIRHAIVGILRTFSGKTFNVRLSYDRSSSVVHLDT